MSEEKSVYTPESGNLPVTEAQAPEAPAGDFEGLEHGPVPQSPELMRAEAEHNEAQLPDEVRAELAARRAQEAQAEQPPAQEAEQPQAAAAPEAKEPAAPAEVELDPKSVKELERFRIRTAANIFGNRLIEALNIIGDKGRSSKAQNEAEVDARKYLERFVDLHREARR